MRDGCAIYFDEGLVPTKRLAIDHSCDYFFTGSAFTTNQNCGARVCRLLDRVLDLFHPGTCAEERREVTLAAYTIAQLSSIRRCSLFKSARDSRKEVVQLKRSRYVVFCTQLRKPEDYLRI